MIPTHHPVPRFGDDCLRALLSARANPLAAYRLGRVVELYSPSAEGLDACQVGEVVLEDGARGTLLERQVLVDLVRRVNARAAARPGHHALRLLNSVGGKIGSMVVESRLRASEVAPEAGARVVLAGVGDLAREAVAGLRRRFAR